MKKLKFSLRLCAFSERSERAFKKDKGKGMGKGKGF
jgi:hypothetical protein